MVSPMDVDEVQSSLSDLNDKLFEKIVYFASGSIGAEVLLALKNGNAQSELLPSILITHCIVGDNYIEADVNVARKVYDATAVTPKWINMSVLCKKLLPTKLFNPFKDNLFSGIIITVSQLSENDCKTLWTLVTCNGGTFQLTLDNNTTHLIVTKPCGRKYDAAIANSLDKIKIVTPNWIIDCLNSNTLCSESNYHPRLLVMSTYTTDQPIESQISLLSTNTGFYNLNTNVKTSSVIPKIHSLDKLKQLLQRNRSYKQPISQPVQLSEEKLYVSQVQNQQIELTELIYDNQLKFQSNQHKIQKKKLSRIQINLLNRKQKLLIMKKNVGTISDKCKMAQQSINMQHVQVKQQQSQQIQQQPALIIGQQQTVSMNTANTWPTTQTQHQTVTILRQNEPQQTKHMDEKTHEPIQSMNQAEHLAFMNILKYHKNLGLKDFNFHQQQAAGLNCMRMSTFNDQNTSVHTLNNQQISTSRKSQTQQEQWNKIYQEQLVVQQQQMTYLPEKTINSTLVTNQQVTQPQTTVCQHLTATAEEDRQITGSKLHINAMQKQQIVSNQPIESVLQSYVQSSETTKFQTSIEETKSIFKNLSDEQTETWTPNHDMFTQYTRQEISAAEQGRLKSVQHTIAQGSDQGIYQPKTVLNNVDNSSVSSCAAQVDKITSPIYYNESTINEIPKLMRKSITQNRAPYQLKYYGHSPNFKLPPNQYLVGCIFLIVEYDQCESTINDVPTWKKIILKLGGEVVSDYTTRITHIICQTRHHPLVQKGFFDGKRCITAYWLSDIVIMKKHIPPWYAYHFPTAYNKKKPCHHMLISLTNFDGDERNRIKVMIELTGAQATSYFSKYNDILVCNKFEGRKVKKALDTNRPIVNVQWLSDIILGHMTCMYQPQNPKYQKFDVKHPFRIDYNQILHLMVAWETPVNISLESYENIIKNPVPINRKRSRSTFSNNCIDQVNNNSSTSDIIIKNINLPPIENRPCVMIFTFGLFQKEEERMVLQLGGTIAQNYSDATHLVMKYPIRNIQFLCCLSTVKYIVTFEWLKDSSIQVMFLDEAIYTVKEVSVDQNVICNVPKVLSNPNRHKLFKGKLFYVTPGMILPPVFVVQQIIESAGGTVEKQRRSWESIQKLASNIYFIIACNEDLHLISNIIEKSYDIYNAEFILSAVMTQYIDYSMAYTQF